MQQSESAQAQSNPTSLPFRAVLTPHRSLPPQGFILVMALLSVISFVTGVAFAMIGAWPVLGFFGLDVLLVYVAFKRNYRAAKSSETIVVTRDDLTVTRIGADGRQRSVARMIPAWTRLDAHEAADGSVHLALATRGRSVRVARDLGHDERRAFAPALRAALELVRRADLP